MKKFRQRTNSGLTGTLTRFKNGQELFELDKKSQNKLAGQNLIRIRKQDKGK